MKRFYTLAFVICLFTFSSQAQSSFFSGKRNTSTDVNLGFSHMVYHFEGAWRGWAVWIDLKNFEIGFGSDFGNYPTTTIEDWTTTHDPGEPYTHYWSDEHMSGASAVLYYGWFFNDYLAAGVMFDFLYGPREIHTSTRNYGYGIGSTTSTYETTPEHIFSAGLYIKGNYQIKDRLNIFLMLQGGLDGNSGFSLGVLYNI